MKQNEKYIQNKSPREGSFAQVSGCKNNLTGEQVAIKELRKGNREDEHDIHRFQREVALIEALAPHPNIIQVLDKHLGDDENWYAMAYASLNLGEYLERFNSALLLEYRIVLFDAILTAMTHAHQCDILHRDLAPTNILLFLRNDGGYDVKVADFGLGRDMKSLSAYTNTGQDGYGHLYYTAPEQLDDLRNASVQSDIYSLGKLLNFICTGRIPSAYHKCDFGPVIRKATETLPNDRYPDIGAFAIAYEEIKGLLIQSEEQTVEERMKAYADGKIKIDWQDFHRYAVAGDYSRHVYHDYLKPVDDVLTSQATVNAYASAVGTAIEDFVRVYIDRIEECRHTTGWPFPALDTFGRVLFYVYMSVSSADVRVECFKELWQLGYVSDQWAVQDLIKRIFGSNDLPAGSEIEIAHVMRTSGAKLTSEQVRKLTTPRLPRVIAQTIRALSNNS